MKPTPRTLPTPGGGAAPNLTLVILAFAAIYLIWGSTYLAIRWAIETMPPLLMAAVRFFIAGAFMFAWAHLKGVPLPSRTAWRDAAVSGSLLLAGGNGAVVLAEQWVPSGLTALLVASVPFWMVLLDARFGSRRPPSTRAVAGLLLGFLGVAILIGSPGAGGGGRNELFGALLVLAGSASWAAGSIYSRYSQQSTGPRQWVGMQMLCGAGVLLLFGVVAGEPAVLDLTAVSTRSLWSLAYLIVFGAVIAYAAYVWLLTVVSPAQVATYAYVNPVVALLLGWALAGEAFSSRALLAGVVIVGAVVVLSRESGRPRAAAPTVELA